MTSLLRKLPFDCQLLVMHANIPLLSLMLSHIIEASRFSPKAQFQHNTTNKAANLSQPTTNLSLGPIPAAFDVRWETSHAPRFDPDAVFINIVEAMRVVAHGDYKERMPLSRFNTARYKVPVISLETRWQVNIPRRLVIWGLQKILSQMLTNNRWETGHFGLYWNTIVYLGGISFGGPEGLLEYPATKSSSNRNKSAETAPGQEHPETSGLEASPTLALTKDHASISNSLDAPLLTVDFVSSGNEMARSQLWLAIVSTMALAAKPPGDAEPPPAWHPVIADLDCQFFMMLEDPATAPPMAYYYVVEAVSQAAQYVVESNDYRGLAGTAKLDGDVAARFRFMIYQ